MPRRQKRKDEDGDQGVSQAENVKIQGQDPGRALLSVSQNFIAACCGSHLRVYNRKAGQRVDLEAADLILQPIRAIQLSKSEHFILAGGDDRLLRVWSLEDGQLLLQAIASKKISAASFTPDCKHIIFADKGGDVYTAPIPNAHAGEQTKPTFLLGHFSTIITSLTVSPCQTRLTTSDREGKIRVNKLPKDLSQPAVSVQAFALGHSAFVTTVLDIPSMDQPCVLSGSGDGSIRLWDRESGAELDNFQASKQAEGDDNKPSSSGLESGPHAHPAIPSEERQKDNTFSSQGGKKNDVTSLTIAARAESSDNLIGQKRSCSVQGVSSGVSERGGVADDLWEGAHGHLDEEDTVVGDAGEGDLDMAQLQGREKLPPAVIQIAHCPTSQMYAACLEAATDIVTLRVTPDRRIQAGQRVRIPGLTLPNSLAFDHSGNLWGASGVEGQIPFQISVLPKSGVSMGGSRAESEATEDDIEAICTPELCQAIGADFVGHNKHSPLADTSKMALGSQVSLELRKWIINEDERERRKRNRSDIQRKLT